jgi:predicted acetyltransferase
MKLVAASMEMPKGLDELIADLGAGENGFSGTQVAQGELTLREYVQLCIDMTDAAKLRPGFVQQTVFWALDENGLAVGMVRMRHTLNERLKDRGGHIGYYVRRNQRGRGYGQEMLRLALLELAKLGERRALLTVEMDNIASVRVIQANGGVLESVGQEADGKKFGRYWIDLNS